MQELLSILIGLSGAAAAIYAVNPRWFGVPLEGAGGGERPWRRLGAGICAVTSLMFLLGAALMKPRESPRAYLAFWAVLLGLVMWLIVLAFKDARHTLKRYLDERRGQRRNGPDQPANGPDGVDGD
ncbi:MAG: hypothetical protein IT449_07810 [Phycisphaerales bacterium]|nr:hypothetical protein [Phycisphaerales bacterium]